MPRLAYADAAALEALLSGPRANLPRLNTFRMFAHAPPLAKAWLGVTQALMADLALSPVLREIAILQVARDAYCLYMWTQHARIARRVGVGDEVVLLIDGDGRGDACPDQALVRAAAREAAGEGRVSRATFDALVSRLGSRQAIELTLVIGHYLAGAVFLKTCEVELEARPGAGPPGA